MPLYQYVKAPPPRPRLKRKKPWFLSFLLMSAGGVLLVWVAWPILSFTALSDALFPSVVSPVGDAMVLAAATTEDQSTSVDFTNANVWFPTAPQKKTATPVNTYTVSVPKLKIVNALVAIGGDDLNAGLVHYGGTGLPGQYGNAVVFGHSTLPQFYDPKNYKTIFSLLPTLKVGDTFDVTYDGVTYSYGVEDMVVKDPTDVSALEQRFDDSYITLVTCVPPGTYWQRLNVRARLIKT